MSQKYTIETLMPLNEVYHMQHRLLQSDADMANKHKAIIKASRSDSCVQVGDIIELTTKNGDFYRNAHVEKSCLKIGGITEPAPMVQLGLKQK